VNNSAQVLFHAEISNSSSHIPSTLGQAQELLTQALSWVASIPEDKRTVGCSHACATVVTNMALIAEQAGDLKGAQKLFKEAEKYAKKAGFTDVAQEARNGLKAVSTKLDGIKID
jgi:hypothetical protein